MDNVSRRGFLGATAGAVGVAAAIGELNMAAAQDNTTQEGAAQMPEKKGLRVGMLTAPFMSESLETIADFAKQAQIASLEIMVEPEAGPLQVVGFDAAKAEAVKKLVADRGLEISSLAFYGNPLEEGKTEEMQAFFRSMIDAAALLGVPTLCTNAGFPAPNMSKVNTIKKVLPKLFNPVIEYAGSKRINIALENWFETNLQGLDTFEALFETFEQKNFGLNYDPSHLYHQQLNYFLPVKLYSERIFHTHAKDCLVDLDERGRVGIYGKNWWRYVIPGYGNINWGEYISFLKYNRYEGVMSIEHEDGAFGREEGFIAGARYLNQFC